PGYPKINTPKQHWDAVAASVADWRPPVKVQRVKKSDEEIIKLVPNMWDRAKGSSSRMLRVLRDEEEIDSRSIPELCGNGVSMANSV
ncbi:MAG: hypothetical protein QF593_12030, partial [Nitrospinota bacterium]|nr:hypothetical protein [Nitrospinota bacterium]